MTTHSVANQGDWNALSLTSGDTINITSSFSFSDTITVHSLTDIILEGNNNTITATSNYGGIVTLFGGTVQNLNINGGGFNINSNNGGLIKFSGGFIQYGNLTNVHVSNLILTQGGSAGIGAYQFGNATTESIINKCSSTVTIGAGNCSGFFLASTNIRIQNSFYNGYVSDGLSVIGCLFAGGSSDINIIGSYCNTLNTVSGSNINGFCSEVSNSSLSKCYSLLNISSDGGGFLGTVSGTCTISDCYYGGNTSSTAFSGFARLLVGGLTLNIYNSYSVNNAGYGINRFVGTGVTINSANVVSNGTTLGLQIQ